MESEATYCRKATTIVSAVTSNTKSVAQQTSRRRAKAFHGRGAGFSVQTAILMAFLAFTAKIGMSSTWGISVLLLLLRLRASFIGVAHLGSLKTHVQAKSGCCQKCKR